MASHKSSSVDPRATHLNAWEKIVKHNAFEFEKEKIERKLKQQEDKNRLKTELEDQILQKRKIDCERKEEERKFDENQKKRTLDIEMREKNRKDEQKNKILHEKIVRDKQLHGKQFNILSQSAREGKRMNKARKYRGRETRNSRCQMKSKEKRKEIK